MNGGREHGGEEGEWEISLCCYISVHEMHDICSPYVNKKILKHMHQLK